MPHSADNFPPDLNDLSRADWYARLFELGRDRGSAEQLDAHHCAVFVEAGDTLLVSFENQAALTAVSETNTPYGLNFVASRNWSSLSVLSNGDTWFRSEAIFRFFDRLTENGFLDSFSRVVFFGSSPAAHAACAYSIAAPRSRVVALQPQATLAPERAGWDDRFLEQRGLDFTSRYGYAPDMLDAAEHAYILFDPYQRRDAMHAAQFRGRHIDLLPLPFQGPALQVELHNMGVLDDLLVLAADDKLDQPAFAALMRAARRRHFPYLRRLLNHLELTGRNGLAYQLCRYVADDDAGSWFQQKLAQLQEQAHHGQDRAMAQMRQTALKNS